MCGAEKGVSGAERLFSSCEKGTEVAVQEQNYRYKDKYSQKDNDDEIESRLGLL
jgi:hypothetical protein